MDRLSLNKGARTASSLIAMIALLSFLFNSATIVVYSQSGTKADQEAADKAKQEEAKEAAKQAEAEAKAKAKPKAKHPKPPSPKPPSPKSPSPTPPSPSAKNVRNYGAKGDGVTDDLTAINAALNAAGINGIYFPAGTYLVSGPIKLNSVSAYGESAATSIVVGNISIASSAVFILTGTGSSISTLSVSTKLTKLQTNDVNVQSAKNFSIQKVRFAGSPYYSLLIDGGNNGTISGNTFSASSYSHVDIESTNYLQVTGNSFNFNGQYCISSDGSTAATVQLNIAQNLFQAQSGNYYSPAIWLSNISSSTIASNTFSAASAAISAGAIELYGAPWGPITDVQISGNQCTNCALSESGAIALRAAASSLGVPAPIQNVQITSNKIQMLPNSLSNGIYTRAPAFPGGIQNLTVSNNTIVGASTGYSGIYVNDTNGATITGNSISNGPGEGIFLASENGGAINISHNNMANLGGETYNDANSTDSAPVSVINIQDSSSGIINYTSVNISSNNYNAPVNNLAYYIYCGASKSITTVSGNTTNTTLQTYIAQ